MYRQAYKILWGGRVLELTWPDEARSWHRTHSGQRGTSAGSGSAVHPEKALSRSTKEPCSTWRTSSTEHREESSKPGCRSLNNTGGQANGRQATVSKKASRIWVQFPVRNNGPWGTSPGTNSQIFHKDWERPGLPTILMPRLNFPLFLYCGVEDGTYGLGHAR